MKEGFARRAAPPLWGALVVTLVGLHGAPLARAHGPDGAERIDPIGWVLPVGVEVVASRQEGERLDLYLEDGGRRWSELELEAVVRAALEDAYEAGLGVTGVVPYVARGAAWVPLPAVLPPAPAVPEKPWERGSVSADPGGVVRKSLTTAVGARRRGALSGKVVYVSAGHGFTWDPAIARWATQRGNTHGIVEDMVSNEAIAQWLTTYLENAGATVFTVRERDMNPHMVIVDAEAGAATSGEGEGSYAEEGTWSDSTGGGFRGGLAPYEEGENPFALGTSRVTPVAASATATARWTFSVPAPGDYRVYAAWVAGDNRAPDAHYVVHHDGGASHLRVNQRRHGGTWMSLGRFHFAREGAVELHNDSATSGSHVSADAIRVGGGMGDAARGDGGAPPRGTLSGRPRWEENARYHVQFTGAPQSVYRYAGDERSDDVGVRSRYAAWQNEVGEDAVYVSWHTNAPSPGVGTSTFVYGPNPPDGSYDFTGTPGSDRLGRFLHDEVVNDLKAAVDPAWRNRGLFSAYFGELNKNHNPEMPSALCEVAFHATESDAAHLKEPRVRMVAARAFYQAVARYFAERDGQEVVLLPEPPEAVRVVGVGPGRARVSWRAAPVDAQDLGGHAASGFRLYRSADGRGWDDGIDVAGPSAEVEVPTGAPSFFRVTSYNDGGESVPSPVVAVMPACEAGAKGLIVHGFYRADSGLAPREDLSAYGLSEVLRVRMAEMNRFDGVVAHAWALASAGLAFDSAEATALGAGGLALEGYGLVDWVLGEESTADETFSEAEQALVGVWLTAGRTLIASGAELAWDLGDKGSASDRAFLASLGVGFEADDAGTYALTWEGGALALDDGTRGAYDVNYPDVLAVVGGGEVVLRYEGGAVAGVATRTASGGTAVVLGVPIEALFPEVEREAFVRALVEGLGGARASGCEVAPDAEPEAGPESAEAVEPVEPGPDAQEPAETVGPEVVVGEGAEVGRTAREVIGASRQVDGGCASGGARSFVSWLMGVLFIVSGSSARLVRRRRDGRAP